MKYYDVTFHELSGKSIVKRNVPSDKEAFDIWQDACIAVNEQELYLVINEETQVILNRRYIVRIDIAAVENPLDKELKRRDEIAGVINTLSNMGF